MKSYKKGFFILCLFLTSAVLSGQVLNDSQIPQDGHWIYDSIIRLTTESGSAFMTSKEPLSISELKFYFEQVDYDTLSESGKTLYKRVHDYLYTNESAYTDNAFAIDTEAVLNTELYTKNNSDIPWTFTYNNNGNLFTAPIRFGFGNLITVESHFFFGKNYFASKDPDNFTNVPLSFNDIRFHFPTFAYISFSRQFEGWGMNFHIGKQGKSIGNTQTGSIIYNNTFETDMYSSLSIYSKSVKVTFDVSQVSYNQFLYLHQYEFKPADSLRLEFLEGSMINDTFSLRQLNPFMVMHSFMGNYEQMTSIEHRYYNESKVCAYLGLDFDWVPFKNSRIYGLYAMTEMQLPTELYNNGLLLPDGFGIQLGYEQTIPASKGYFDAGLEVVYASPFLYVKQTPETSLIRLRYYNETPDLNSSEPVATWIGSPFGPDCFAVQTSVAYDDNEKWSLKLGYLFKIHGDNYDEMLWGDNYEAAYDELGNPANVNVYNYYPLAKYKIAIDDEEDQSRLDEIIDEARELWMSGTPEYTNQITVDAAYNVTESVSLAGKLSYSLIFNCNNTAGSTQHGFEAALSCKVKLF